MSRDQTALVARRSFFQTRERHHFVRLASALALLVLSALPIQRLEVSDLEAALFHALNGLPGGLYWGAWTFMQLGNLVAVPLVALGALAFRRVRLAVDLIVAGGLAWGLAKVVKALVPRGRPAELLDDVVLRHAPAVGHGFISGHAALATALATVVSPYLSLRLKVVAWTLAAFVCLARVYVGAHLPLDVVGGAALGWALGSLVHVLIGAPGKRESPPQSELRMSQSSG